MNPEDSFRRLEDPDNWTFRLDERAGLVPARRKWSPLVVSFATVAAVAVVGIVVFSVFGLGVRSIHNPAAPPLPTATASPIPTPTPTSTPTTALGGIGDATCSNLLNKSTRAQLESDGATSAPEGWNGSPSTYGQDAVFSISDENILGLQAFTSRGGIACRWGIDGASDLPTYFAYGPISEADAAVAGSVLQTADGNPVIENGIKRYVTYRQDSTVMSGEVYTGDFAFSTDGYWAYGYSPGFGTDVLAEVLANAPTFGHTVYANTGPMLLPDKSVNCTNLLDASEVSTLKSTGWVPTRNLLSPNGEEPASTHVPFDGATGTFCVWGPKPDPQNGTDASLSFGYGPIRADDAAQVQLILTELGATSTASHGVTRVTGGTDGKEWAFSNDHWAVAFTMGGDDRTAELLSEVIRNAPQF